MLAKKLKSVGRVEAVCLAALMLSTVVAGFQQLQDWKGPAFTLTNELYVPSVMFAAGRGFINPPVDEVPGLRDFLYLQEGVHRFDPAQIPDNVTPAPMDTYQRYHRYLVYAMGWVWRLTGISWDTAKLLAVGQYAACALAGYGILRLFLSPVCALAGALLFVLSPTVGQVVFNIRDFSKAPFLLATMLGTLHLLRTPRCPRTYLRVAIALGVVVGVGLGFRRDLLVAIPPVLFVLALAPMHAAGWNLRRRALSSGAFLGVVALLGAPVFMAFQEKGSLVAHDILMGMATELDDELGLSRAVYERMPVRHDAYVSGVTSALGLRIESEILLDGKPQPRLLTQDPAKNEYLMRTLKSFPADMVMRAEAATLRVLRGVANLWTWRASAWSAHIEQWGWCYALLCFLAGAVVHPYRAWLALALLLYFCGITSLQYEFRHAFHLLVIPVLCFLLPFEFLLRRAQMRWRRRGEMADHNSSFRTSARNLWKFTCAAMAVTVLPWLLCLPFQLRSMAQLRTALDAAPREPVSTRQVVIDDWTYFVPERPVSCVFPLPAVEQPWWQPLYLMAELDVTETNLPIHILTESDQGWHDFSQVVKVWPSGVPREGRVRYYFQVPQRVGEKDWVRFTGVGLPSALASSFRGLYTVTETRPLGTNINYAVTDHFAWSHAFKTVSLAQYGMARWWMQAPEPNARKIMREARLLLDAGKLDEAEALFHKSAAWGIFTMERYGSLAQIQQLRGDEAGRVRLLLEGLSHKPNDTALAYALDRYVIESGPGLDALGLWGRAAAVAPDNPVVRSRLKLETEKANAGNTATSS